MSYVIERVSRMKFTTYLLFDGDCTEAMAFYTPSSVAN